MASAPDVGWMELRSEYLRLQMCNLYFHRVFKITDGNVSHAAGHHVTVQGQAVVLLVLQEQLHNLHNIHYNADMCSWLSDIRTRD